ncbi:MAG: hypothetical protein KIG73_00285, partial [Alphaproteobacteria bacterium]|nr:hypothetical protein [Alphaproteobacteria bacterium]
IVRLTFVQAGLMRVMRSNLLELAKSMPRTKMAISCAQKVPVSRDCVIQLMQAARCTANRL